MDALGIDIRLYLLSKVVSPPCRLTTSESTPTLVLWTRSADTSTDRHKHGSRDGPMPPRR